MQARIELGAHTREPKVDDLDVIAAEQNVSKVEVSVNNSTGAQSVSNAFDFFVLLDAQGFDVPVPFEIFHDDEQRIFAVPIIVHAGDVARYAFRSFSHHHHFLQGIFQVIVLDDLDGHKLTEIF
jgi:hypothetical protein